MQFRVINTEDPKYEKEKLLRWEVHHKPKGLPPGSEEIPEEEQSLHLVALEKKDVVGCVLFHPEGVASGSLYQFAISEEYRGRGFGRQMIAAMEKELLKRGIKEIYLQVQKEGMPFYLKMGYRPCMKQKDGANSCLTLRKKLES